MMRTSSSIPLSFVDQRRNLSWQEIAFGLREGWVNPSDVINTAMQRASANYGENTVEVELAGLQPGEEHRVHSLVDRLSEQSSTSSEDELKELWLRIILAWVYEMRDAYDDPLGIVEQLYADFGYPDEIRHLVRHNPPTDEYRPQDHSHTENIARLFEMWRQYVDEFLPMLDSSSDD